jgi:polyketide cyclase/dehydrase/lipid transport protein
MAVVERVMAATPEQIFAVLADGWSYSDWVVGTAHIRDVDNDWPEPGSQLYHKAAVWPLALKDRTVVVGSAPPHWIELRAHLRPIGELTVKFTLTPVNEVETRVTMREHFDAGPMGWLRTKADDLLLHWRNREALRRLDDLATRKAARTGSSRR